MSCPEAITNTFPNHHETAFLAFESILPVNACVTHCVCRSSTRNMKEEVAMLVRKVPCSMCATT